MELIPHPNKRFMAKFERYEPAVGDHTSRIAAKKCLRRYFYQIVLGFREKFTEPYFAFGGAYHKFREVLEVRYKELNNQIPQNTPVRVSIFEENADTALEEALTAAGKFWEKRGSEPVVGTKYDFLTGKRLFKSCMEAFKFWKNEKAAGRVEVIATEQSFIVTLSDGKTKIGGRADQIVRWNGKLWGRDFKTSSKMGKFYERTLEPNDQFTRYTLGESLLCGETVQGQLVEVMYNTKKEGPKIEAKMTTRSEAQLKMWEDEQIFYENKILQVCRDEDKWPMEEASCPFCPFRDVCCRSNEESQMAALENNFIQKPWDFTTLNEDDEE